MKYIKLGLWEIMCICNGLSTHGRELVRELKNPQNHSKTNAKENVKNTAYLLEVLQELIFLTPVHIKMLKQLSSKEHEEEIKRLKDLLLQFETIKNSLEMATPDLEINIR